MIFISASFPCAALVHMNRSIRLLGLEGWSKLIVFQIGALAFAGMQLNASNDVFADKVVEIRGDEIRGRRQMRGQTGLAPIPITVREIGSVFDGDLCVTAPRLPRIRRVAEY
jgi:hypothetical protein